MQALEHVQGSPWPLERSLGYVDPYIDPCKAVPHFLLPM